MATFLEQKNAVIMLLDDSLEFAHKTNYPASVENIQTIKEKLEKKEIIIVVCGEVKRGKSSLLSAFLEERDLFPIDVNVATNTATIIRYGDVEKIEVIFENDGKYDTQSITRSEIGQYVSEQGNRWNEKKVSCLTIEIPNPKLKDGLVFVDTPGVGSLNLAHSEVTYGYLPNADILIFVSDALSDLTEPELTFLQSASKYCQNIIYPLTKVDKTSDYMEIYQQNSEKISRFTSKPQEEIRIVPVSSLAKIKYMENRNSMLLKSSKYKDLEDEIWKLVSDKRGQIVLIPPLTELTQELSTLRNNLKIKYTTLTADNSVISEIEDELRCKTKEKQKLLDEASEWRGQFSHELSLLNNEIVKYIQKQPLEIEGVIIECAEQKGAVQNLEQMTNNINGILSNVTLNAKDYILEKTNELIQSTEEKLGLLISANEDITDTILFEPGQVAVRVPKENKSEKVFKVGRDMAIKSGAAGTLVAVAGGITGATLGFFLGGPVGALVGGKMGAGLGFASGAVLGSGKGLVDGIKKIDNPSIQQIQQAYMKYVNNKLKGIIDSVNLTIKNLSYTLTNELSNMIKAQKSILDKNILEIQENLKLSKTESAKRANEMKPVFEALNILDTRINQLTPVIVQCNKPSTVKPSPQHSPFVKNNDEKQVAPASDKQDANEVSLDFMEV